jgi:uncharacterized protein YjiS (DUF1127 family)
MSGFPALSLPAPRLRRGPAAALRGAATGCAVLLIAGLERARQRRALGRLDDRLLRDIGLDRRTAEQEVERLRWPG